MLKHHLLPETDMQGRLVDPTQSVTCAETPQALSSFVPQQQKSLVPAAAKQMIGLPVEYARYPSCHLQQQALAFVPRHVSERLESLPAADALCFCFETEVHDSLRTVPLLLLLVNGFSAATDKFRTYDHCWFGHAS